jgi:hypothetical protein
MQAREIAPYKPGIPLAPLIWTPTKEDHVSEKKPEPTDEKNVDQKKKAAKQEGLSEEQLAEVSGGMLACTPTVVEQTNATSTVPVLPGTDAFRKAGG